MQHDLLLRGETSKSGVATLHVGGVVDAHTLDRFDSALSKALGTGARSLILDCEELRYVNSSGFGELIRYSDRFREKGGQLVLARVPPKVGIILEMLGLKSLIPIASSLEEAATVALEPPAREPEPSTAAEKGAVTSAPAPRPGLRTALPALQADQRVVVCAFCDTRIRIGGAGRWGCPACGAPFTTSPEGGIAFDWSRADSEAVHLTFDVTPRTLASFAGALEGILTERRVPHARMRRFAREAAHVCHLIAENAWGAERRGPLHVLALAGPQRLHLRIVDKGRSLESDAARLFETQSRLFLDFSYTTPVDGVHVTEFAFAYEGAGAFVA